MRGFRQFDAPVSVVITVDKDLADDTVANDVVSRRYANDEIASYVGFDA